jgi:hypothetical protein
MEDVGWPDPAAVVQRMESMRNCAPSRRSVSLVTSGDFGTLVETVMLKTPDSKATLLTTVNFQILMEIPNY